MSLNMQCKCVNFIKGKDKKNYNPSGMPLSKLFLRIMSFKYALHNQFIHSTNICCAFIYSFIQLN